MLSSFPVVGDSIYVKKSQIKSNEKGKMGMETTAGERERDGGG